jgi:hypothetical protein
VRAARPFRISQKESMILVIGRGIFMIDIIYGDENWP